jgi:hypothetical protein
MKLMQIQRGAISVLVSVSLIGSSLPISAHARPVMDQPPPHASGNPNNQGNQNQDKDDQGNNKKKPAKRVSKEEQDARIKKQQANMQLYKQNIALREEVAERDEQILRQQKRIAHLRFQEAYRQRLAPAADSAHECAL